MPSPSLAVGSDHHILEPGVRPAVPHHNDKPGEMAAHWAGPVPGGGPATAVLFNQTSPVPVRDVGRVRAEGVGVQRVRFIAGERAAPNRLDRHSQHAVTEVSKAQSESRAGQCGAVCTASRASPTVDDEIRPFGGSLARDVGVLFRHPHIKPLPAHRLTVTGQPPLQSHVAGC